MGKRTFYPKVAKALKSKGYQYFDGDKDVKGKGKSHASKPDYIAIKGKTIIIGEIKSPSEGPFSSSWRQIQKGDSKHFKKIRKKIAELEKLGKLSKVVGGHIIIISGQLPDYVTKINKSYDLPIDKDKDSVLMAGYSFPSNEIINVKAALKDSKKRVEEKIDIENGSTTYIYDI